MDDWAGLDWGGFAAEGEASEGRMGSLEERPCDAMQKVWLMQQIAPESSFSSVMGSLGKMTLQWVGC